jgi:hypothetical protein
MLQIYVKNINLNTMNKNTICIYSQLNQHDSGILKLGLHLKTNSYTYFSWHPSYYKLTPTTLNVTMGTSLEQKHKLLFAEQTGHISGKAKMAPDGKPYGQSVRGTFNFDVPNPTTSQNIENLLRNGEFNPWATRLKSLNLDKTLLEPPIIVKPQQMEAFAEKFAPDPSKKYTRDNPFVAAEYRIWGAKLEHDEAYKLEQHYLKLLKESSNTNLEIKQMRDLYTDIQKTLYTARINKNPTSRFL